jgi:hypothetical protein
MFAQRVRQERPTSLGIMTHLATTRNAMQPSAALMNEW